MRIKVRGTYHIRHLRDGKVLADFETRNSLTRRGAFDLFARTAQMSGNNGGVDWPFRIPETEGAQLQDFISIFWWNSYFIEQEGDGVLAAAGDYDSGRGIHRDDRVRYFDQGTGNDLVPPLNDNREWNGDLHGIKGGNPRSGNSTVEDLDWDTWDGVPYVPPMGGIPTLPRNVSSAETLMIHRAEGPRSYRGAWWFQHRTQSDFGQSCVVASAVFPQAVEMRKFDYLEVTYKLSFNQTVAV